MSEETVVSESTPEVNEAPVTEVQESVTEDSQPPVDEQSDSSSEEATEETVVDAVQKALTEDDEPEPKAEVDDTKSESKPEDTVPDKEPDQETEKAEEKEQKADSEEPELYREPEGLQPKASRRFQDLVADNKTKDHEISQAKEAVTQIQKTVTDSGLSPEEFAVLLDYGKLATSSDRTMKEHALQFARGEVQRLSKEMGVEVEGVDLLDDFSDLKDQVDSYELSREHAVELANSRRNQQRVEQRTQVAQQQQQAQNQQVGVTQDAAVKIQSFMDAKKKTDIDFSAKEKYLLDQVGSIQKNYPPSQWPAVIEQLYSAVGSMASTQTQQVKKTAQAPLSSSGNTSGPASAGSMVDAIMTELSG